MTSKADTSQPAPISPATAIVLKPVETSIAFVDSVGVNMHSGMSTNVPYAYRNPQLVEKALEYLGIKHIRDGIGIGFGKDGYDYTTITEDYLADRGYKFDFPISSLATEYILALHNFVSKHPGALLSLEGPNEANTWKPDQLLMLQKSLIEFVHGDSLLTNVQVLSFTLAYTQNLKYLAKYGDLTSISDQGNVHIYATGGRSPSAFQYQLDIAQAATPGSKMNVTEAGYSTLPSNAQYGVDEATQARYILDLLMDNAEKRVAKTYIYELLDRNGPTDTSLQGNFGLFHADGTPKAAANAIHNLVTILNTGAQSNFEAGQLGLVLNRPLDKSVHKIVIQKNASTYDVVFWAEPNIWNPTKQQGIQAPVISIDLSFLTAATASVFDPLIGTTALQVFSNPKASSVVQVIDHPVIVEVTLPTNVASDIPTYKNGVLVKEVITYVPGDADISLTKVFNTTGILTSETYLHADKSKDLYLSAILGKSYVAEHDVYNPAGKLVEITRTHGDGGLDYHFVLDGSGTKTTDIYNATGKLRSHVETRAGGYSDTLIYKNGVLVSEVVKFGSGGAEVGLAKAYANVGGQEVLKSETQVHAGGAKDVYDTPADPVASGYQRKHLAYDSSGKIAFTDRINLDGTHTQSVSQAGVTLASTPGVADTFKSMGGDKFTFRAGFGHDVVTGFHPGSGLMHDVLVLDRSEVQDFAALRTHITSSGEDLLINLGGGDTILLTRVAPADITAADVHFHDYGHSIV